MARAEKTGETRTLFGRLRRFPEVKSSNFNIRQQALRAAVNMTIQGTAADLIKMAMASLHGRLGREGRAARMLIQVHDELVLETPPEEVPALRELLRHEMENVHELNVPLHVEIKEGDNWLEAKKERAGRWRPPALELYFASAHFLLRRAPPDGGWRESRVSLPRILVVDDDRAAREILGEGLESAGYRCVAAPNGAEALAKARQG